MLLVQGIDLRKIAEGKKRVEAEMIGAEGSREERSTGKKGGWNIGMEIFERLKNKLQKKVSIFYLLSKS